MEKVKKVGPIKLGTKEFFKHWGSYVFLIVTTNLVITGLLVPLIRMIGTKLIYAGKITYLTNSNLVPVFLKHPFVLAGLLVLGVFIIFALLWQFTFLIYGIKMIQTVGSFRPLALLKYTLSQIRAVSWKSLPFFFIYTIVTLPFTQFYFSNALLDKVKIPKFISETYVDQPLFLVFLVVLLPIIIFLGTRFLYFLPNLIMLKMPVRQSVKESWHSTKGQSWRIFGRILGLNIIVWALHTLVFLAFYGLQTVLDKLPTNWPLYGATFNLGAMEIIARLITLWGMVVFYQMLIPKDFVVPESVQTIKRNHHHKLIASGLVGALAILLMINNAMYLTGALVTYPMAISHRGVNGDNGVQNTIPAMADTIKAKPDYVEMDIHETKDGQFVVIHDNNLKELAGINKVTHDFTLKEITDVTVSENEHQAKIPSFDDYLAYADAHKQKLLIEIKTTPQDSNQLVKHFVERYQADILKQHHLIHTLDYNVVKQLKTLAPDLKAGFILPFNFVYPTTDAYEYTMEQTTIDDNFIQKAHDEDKKLFVWTVDDATEMDNLFFMNVDGIITDDLSVLNTEIKAYKDNPTYAQRLLLYISQLTSTQTSEN